MKLKTLFYYRKIHRYFGVIIGIQFLFWTLGGMFFAWSNMDQIHGDTNKKQEKRITALEGWINPGNVFTEISKSNPLDSLLSFKAINFLEKPFYQVRYFTNGQEKVSLVDAQTGRIRPPLSQTEAEKVAKSIFTPQSEIEKTVYLTEDDLNKHHEYRGQPLPAYVVRFTHDSGTTVYVSTEYGQVIKLRNSNWRIFDFLWMMHTMDYYSRDHFGNVLLRIFSILGLITILSGFMLYIKTIGWRNS